MKLSHRIAAAAIGLACLSASSWASVLFTLDNGNSYNVEYVAGSSTGNSKAILEVAFSPSQYVLFGYQWDSTKSITATDMVLAVDAAAKDAVTGQTIDSSETLSATAVSYDYGVYFSSFSYKSLSGTLDWDKLLWWGYYTSADGVTWAMPGDAGSSDITLTNGGFQGFAYGNYAEPVSVSAVPEPASLGLLIIGLIMKYRRR